MTDTRQPSPRAPLTKKRCLVYVDGFNLYYGALEANHTAIKVTVYIPTLPAQAPQRRNDFYLRIGVTCRPLPLADILRHQFPPTITLPNGTTLSRPADWK